MLTNNAETAAPKSTNFPLLGMALLTSLLSILAGLAFIFHWRYLQLGYTSTYIEAVGELATGGAEVWSTDRLLLYLLLVAWAGTLAFWCYQALFRPPRGSTVIVLALAVLLAALLLTPRWVDFQVRFYNGPAQIYQLDTSYRITPVFHYSEETQVEPYSEGDDSQKYACTNRRTWKFAQLKFNIGLYPILDAANELSLLRTHCTPLPPKHALQQNGDPGVN